MVKAILTFIVVLTGSLCNAQSETTTSNDIEYPEFPYNFSPPRAGGQYFPSSSPSSAPEKQEHVPGRSLPTTVVAGASIALVLLFVLIVFGFWYAWKKSQEGSIEINPIPYGEAGVSLRTLPVPEN